MAAGWRLWAKAEAVGWKWWLAPTTTMADGLPWAAVVVQKDIYVLAWGILLAEIARPTAAGTLQGQMRW